MTDFFASIPLTAGKELEREGRTWVRGAISSVARLAMDFGLGTRGDPGARFTLECARPLLREVTAITRVIMPRAEPVRVLAFDKYHEKNWTLPWHQDRVVALKERVEVPGFSNWTRKDGIWHAEPPIGLMERMLFARVHLDPATPENGCLKIALRTHIGGKISAANAESVALASTVEDCVAERGDILLAKALILHRSSPSRVSTGRRAIRIDYCADSLPAPLEWAA